MPIVDLCAREAQRGVFVAGTRDWLNCQKGATMTREALIKKYGSISKAAVKMGLTRRSLQRRLKDGKPIDEHHKKNITTFRELYDKSFYIPKKIKAELDRLGSGWDYEIDFAKAAGVSLSDLAAVREQFHEYIVQLGRDGRRAWSGSKVVAEQMRRMV